MDRPISARVQRIADDVVIAPTARIVCDSVQLGPGVVIEDDVEIHARDLRIGHGSRIERRTTIKAIGGPAAEVRVGDFGMIGHDGILRVPVFTVGDYAAIHNHVLINGYEPCTVGHNTFVGQHSVLNSTAKLTIGNNFRMGTNGYVWTHAESGELLEGCTIYSQRPVVIEDDVWLAGCNNSISPGLRIRRGTIILIGSNITHDTEAWHCYGGSPAQDLTDKLVPYRPVTHHEKVTMMREFAAAFVESTPEFSGAVEFVARAGDPVSVLGERIVVAADGGPQPYDDSTSVFSISDKTYIKVRSVIEQKFMRFLVGARARFLPVE